MRRYRTVIIVALMGIIPMIAIVFAMRFILPADKPRQTETHAAVSAQPVPPPAVEEPKLREVLAAAHNLPVGTLLGEQHVTRRGVELDLLIRGHIAVDDVDHSDIPYGYVVREAIAYGAPLTWQALVGPQQRGFLAAVLKPGMRAITVRLGRGTRHSGLVDPGDRVDVVLTAESREHGLQSVLSRTILTDVRVLAVDRRIESAASSTQPDGHVQRTEIVTATLEVFPSQTGLLALGEYKGELALAVRPLTTDEGGPIPAETVELHDLLARPASLPEEPQPPLQRTVRVIRGTAVTGETFEIDTKSMPVQSHIEPSAFENAGIDARP